tara:strand:- start:252 stop:752 length:501 start_codon:yes stop_codon:yes gene_type:complete
MSYLKISLGIFLSLAASRFIPHPPNFTSLLALAFYVPVFFGIKFLPILILSYAITDLFIGMHSLPIFTWGSLIVIALLTKYFYSGIFSRILGALLGATIFFIITNYGVWTSGVYGYTLKGLILCYSLAIPFFTYSLISTFIFSSIFEGFYKLSSKFNLNIIKNKNN